MEEFVKGSDNPSDVAKPVTVLGLHSFWKLCFMTPLLMCPCTFLRQNRSALISLKFTLLSVNITLAVERETD